MFHEEDRSCNWPRNLVPDLWDVLAKAMNGNNEIPHWTLTSRKIGSLQYVRHDIAHLLGKPRYLHIETKTNGNTAESYGFASVRSRGSHSNPNRKTKPSKPYRELVAWSKGSCAEWVR